MRFDWQFPYPSRRVPVLARNVVATSQPLAAQAGLRMLLAGGNAADAAVATAITLTVVEPTSNGIGGDAFAIIWDGQRLHGLNASGRSPAAWTPERFAGLSEMPLRGWDSVTVPGAVSAWVELSARFGRLPFEKLFEPAISYARDGFPVSPTIAGLWRESQEAFREFPDLIRDYCPEGRAPEPGEIFRFPGQAETLEEIAATRGESFYRGEIARRIIAHSDATGGTLTLEDLSDHKADWVGTVSGQYRGVALHEIPPNGQGIAAPMALGILEHFPMGDFEPDSADSLHLQIEAMKLAFADAHRYVADPSAMGVQPQELLDPEYLAERAKKVRMKEAGDPGHGTPPCGGTVYLAAADAGGMMVSMIQSNFWGFGSGIVLPGAGISFQNRGCGFTLEEGHPNRVGPRKRPYHTIIPGFLMKEGRPLMSFGVMGGPMQPQGHVQMVIRLVDYGQNPQAAADAPRWRVLQGREVALEAGFSLGTIKELTERGHQVRIMPPGAFGGAQLICRMEDGYMAASEPRKDGQAVGF